MLLGTYILSEKGGGGGEISLGMQILTEKEEIPHSECTSLLRSGRNFTGNVYFH